MGLITYDKFSFCLYQMDIVHYKIGGKTSSTPQYRTEVGIDPMSQVRCEETLILLLACVCVCVGEGRGRLITWHKLPLCLY
jgi:hypothetical protein